MQITLPAAELAAYVFRQLDCLISDTAKPLAVALSGGSDSRALALFAAEWAQRRRAPAPVALILDHGLRDESLKEAQETMHWAKQHGLETDLHCLNLVRVASGGIQQRAREARYEALIAACQQRSITSLILGQHGDDQIETLLFRLLRGSGLYGLAGMSAKREQQEIYIIRPLLSLPKSSLQQYLRARGEPWIEDPSNDNEDFSRIRLRRWLETHLSDDQRSRLWNIAAACGRIRSLDELFLTHQLNTFCSLNACGFVTVSPALLEQPEEQAQWMLRRIVISVHGSIAMPRQHEVARLYHDLVNEPNKARSLHHCLIFKHQQKLIICREPARCQPKIPIRGAENLRFDHRFNAVAAPHLPEHCYLGALGEDGYRAVKDHTSVPRRAALSLPALWHLEAPVFVPHIDYCASPEYEGTLHLSFSPAKRLAEAPFFPMNEAQE